MKTFNFILILNLALNYFLIDKNGVTGVAYATAITWGLFFVVVLTMDIKRLRRFY